MPDAVDLPDDPPSLGASITMVVVGALMLAPFVLLALTGGLTFNPAATLGALFTVGWGVFIGIALVYYGWQRIKRRKAILARGN